MKIVFIEREKQVLKSKEESQNSLIGSKYKTIQRKEPLYIVEMSMEELQLVSFYLELEKRKPIIDVTIKKENEK